MYRCIGPEAEATEVEPSVAAIIVRLAAPTNHRIDLRIANPPFADWASGQPECCKSNPTWRAGVNSEPRSAPGDIWPRGPTTATAFATSRMKRRAGGPAGPPLLFFPGGGVPSFGP